MARSAPSGVAVIASVVAIGIVVLTGMAGVTSFGQATFMGFGAYATLQAIVPSAWSVAFFYVFGNLDVLGRNDGISGIPPLSVFGTALLDSRSYFPVVWIAVAAALLESGACAERGLLTLLLARPSCNTYFAGILRARARCAES